MIVCIQTISGLSSDMIIFILSGSITIYSTKEEKKTIGEQYMIFLRSETHRRELYKS